MANCGPSGTPEAESSDLRRTIVLHDGGDAILLIGPQESQQPVLVSKTVMSLASPVWRAMFDRHKWAESSATEIPFPDDNVDALLIVLQIAHLRFGDLPPKNGLSFQELVNLAVVCDKYDIVRLVRPFLDLHCWAEGFAPDVEARSNCHPLWLFVAWTFGYVESFESLARLFVTTILENSEGEFTLGQDQEVVLDEMPARFLETILIVREDTLSAMLKACYDLVDIIPETSVCQIKDANRVAPYERECRSMILGSYVEWLFKAGLGPDRLSGATLFASVEEFQRSLNNVKIRTYESHDYAVLTSHFLSGSRVGLHVSNVNKQYFVNHGITLHTKCWKALNLTKKVDRIVSQMPSPISEADRRHIQEQARK